MGTKLKVGLTATGIITLSAGVSGAGSVFYTVGSIIAVKLGSETALKLLGEEYIEEVKLQALEKYQIEKI